MDADLHLALELSVASNQLLLGWKAELHEALRLQDLRTSFEITGDGNCGPRALSAMLYGAEDSHTNVRMKVIEWMRLPDSRESLISAMHRRGVDVTEKEYDDDIIRMERDGEDVDDLFMLAAFHGFPQLRAVCAGFLVVPQGVRASPPHFRPRYRETFCRLLERGKKSGSGAGGGHEPGNLLAIVRLASE